MKKYVLIICITLCLGSSTAISSEPARAFQIIRHDTNQVEMCISNYGKFGQTEAGNAGCWWPEGTNHNYIYGAGIWFGTIDGVTSDTCVTIGYMCCGGAHEFSPGLSGWPLDHPCAIIYINPENWPPPADTFPMAPQDLVSHEDSWCCFNDSNPDFHVFGDTPIGIEVYQTVYEWDLPCVEDIIFLTYEVKNVSGHGLDDCFLAVVADCDIGDEYPAWANDRCTGVVCREYIINSDTIVVDNVEYQWQEEEESGTPPWWPGVIGFDLLQTPFDLIAGEDKDGDGIPDQYERDSLYYVTNLPASMWDVDNDGVPDWRDPSQWPQMSVSALKRFTLSFEPTTDARRYMTMAGYNYLTGVYEPYDTLIPDPDEQRFMLACGPFDLAQDSVVTFIFAVMFADWYGIYLRPDTALALIDQYAEDYYNMYWYLYTGVQENFEKRNAKSEMRILPNPISNGGVISFSLPTAAYVSLKLYNAVGQLVETVYDGVKPAGVYEHRLDTRSLPQGTYFVVLETPAGIERRSFVAVR